MAKLRRSSAELISKIYHDGLNSSIQSYEEIAMRAGVSASSARDYIPLLIDLGKAKEIRINYSKKSGRQPIITTYSENYKKPTQSKGVVVGRPKSKGFVRVES